MKITRVKGTPVLKVDPRHPRAGAPLRWAAAILQNGGVLALPTDTVYGLAADARNETALKRLYSLKGREARKPLACLLGYRQQMLALSDNVPESAWDLAKAHWPGALTLIVPRAPWVPPVLTGGLPRVGLRYPDCPLVWSLIDLLQWPMAASSANLSGQPAAVDSRQVIRDWAGKVDMILDGGRCPVAQESTVVDPEGPNGSYTILRQGALQLPTGGR